MLGMSETGSVCLVSEDESEAYFPGAIHIVVSTTRGNIWRRSAVSPLAVGHRIERLQSAVGSCGMNVDVRSLRSAAGEADSGPLAADRRLPISSSYCFGPMTGPSPTAK